MFLLFYNLSEQSFCIVPYIYVKTTTKKEITRKNKTKICKWFMMFTIHKKTNILFHFYKLHKLFRSKNVCCANSPGNDWFGVNSPVSNVTHCLYLALLDELHIVICMPAGTASLSSHSQDTDSSAPADGSPIDGRCPWCLSAGRLISVPSPSIPLLATTDAPDDSPPT